MIVKISKEVEDDGWVMYDFDLDETHVGTLTHSGDSEKKAKFIEKVIAGLEALDDVTVKKEGFENGS